MTWWSCEISRVVPSSRTGRPPRPLESTGEQMRIGLVVLAFLLLTGCPTASEAQQLQVFPGRVQSMAGSTMILGVVPAAGSGSGSIKVDLTEVPQDQYRALVSGDEIFVTGAIVGSSREGYRIRAISIERVPAQRVR